MKNYVTSQHKAQGFKGSKNLRSWGVGSVVDSTGAPCTEALPRCSSRRFESGLRPFAACQSPFSLSVSPFHTLSCQLKAKSPEKYF